MRLKSWIVCLFVSGLLVAATAADDAPRAAVRHLVALRLEYDRVTTIGAYVYFQAGSRVQDCYVKRGDRVKAGQVLGRLYDQDVQVDLRRLSAEAKSDAAIRTAESKIKYVTEKVKRSAKLHNQHLLNEEEWQSHVLELDTAELEYHQAVHIRKIMEFQRDHAAAEVRSREFIAPHDGMIVELLKNVGESTTPSDSVLQMVSDDLLRAIGSLDVGDVWRVKPGQRVRVFPEIGGIDLPIERKEFAGKVVFVDSRIDPLTRTCKVMAEVPNHNLLLRSGLECRMEIVLETPAAPEAPANPARPATSVSNSTPRPDSRPIKK